MDWDAWLGACPWRPYNPSYVSGGWRGHYDFHTSCIGEWGAHTFAQVQVGLELGLHELARALHMTVGQLLDHMTITEYQQWVVYFAQRQSDRRIASGEGLLPEDLARMTPEQISNAVGLNG